MHRSRDDKRVITEEKSHDLNVSQLGLGLLGTYIVFVLVGPH